MPALTVFVMMSRCGGDGRECGLFEKDDRAPILSKEGEGWLTGTRTSSGSNAKDWIFFRVINWIQKRVDLTVWA